MKLNVVINQGESFWLDFECSLGMEGKWLRTDIWVKIYEFLGSKKGTIVLKLNKFIKVSQEYIKNAFVKKKKNEEYQGKYIMAESDLSMFMIILTL